jgi:type IV secretory pathway VirB6-like protein
MNFFSELKKLFFPFLVALSALSVSLSAAFYSVTGLSKLFAGASFEVLIMASSLEIAKLVIASLLYQYWDKLNKLLRFYLTTAYEMKRRFFDQSKFLIAFMRP